MADERYMKQILVTVTILMAAGLAACTKNATAPSTSTTTTVATTTTTTSTATTTTTSVPGPITFTLTGLISDIATNRPLAAEIEIVEGANVGIIFRSDANGLYSASNLSPGTFTMRVRAFGYESTDVRGVTITNANLRVDVQLRLAPISTTTTTSTTTTSVSALKADFSVSPVPCTISGSGATVDCTVDASASTGTLTGYEWKYKGKTITGNAKISLLLACSDLGAQKDDTVIVTLTVTDDTGATATVTKGVVIVKNGACGF